MQIISIQENQKEQWDKFIASNPSGSFLQSWSWGKFQESLGKKVWRLSIIENNEIVSAALIIKHNLLFGWNYFYCPRPIAKNKEQKTKNKNLFFEEIKNLAKKEKAVFLRVDPSSVIPVFPSVIPAKAGIHDVKSDSAQARENFIELRNLQGQRIWKKTKSIQPQHTLILNIKKSEEEILAQMKQKTRYNIRLAGKKGVKIKKISQPNNQEIQTFLNLTVQTSKRDKFKSHPEEYYQKMLKILCANSMAKLFLAEYQNKIIAANIVIFFSDEAVYLHGASSNEYRNVMAPYLLQWKQIKEAKRLGCQSYDFWGVKRQPEEKKGTHCHPKLVSGSARFRNKFGMTRKNKFGMTEQNAWAGITKFKKGFGGEEISCPDSYDVVFNLIKYWIYRIGKKIL